MYTMALVDRTNLGSARIAGLDEATGLNVANRASITSKCCPCMRSHLVSASLYTL